MTNNNNNNFSTFWHQPTDSEAFDNPDKIEQCLKKHKIEYKIQKSFMKNHMAFSVHRKDLNKAIPLIENNFGRNI